MAEIRVAEAIARARERLGLKAGCAATAWMTRREDRPGESYYLIVFGDGELVQGVAAVATTGEVMEWANLPGVGSHSMISIDDAKVRAGLSANAEAELIWKPCHASRSLLYPIWKVSTADRLVYVDQQGRVWSSLEASGHGG